MSRRGRALAFLLAGARARPALAAAIADGYGVERRPRLRRRCARSWSLGAALPAGERDRTPSRSAAASSVRRVPARFVPPGALGGPGRSARAWSPRRRLPAGSYLLASQLRAAGRRPSAGPALGRGRRPVEIAVSGADALLARPAPAGRGEGRRGRHHRTERRRARAAPTSPRRRCRCWRSARAPKARARGDSPRRRSG